MRGRRIPIDHAKGGHVVDRVPDIDEIRIALTIDEIQPLVFVELEMHEDDGV